VIFLDDKGLPVGHAYTSDHIPENQPNTEHVVYTYSFPEPDILSTATTVLVYTSFGS
jgi:hypothetical protein